MPATCFQREQPAPADLRKDAGAFDLPISLGLLISTGQIVADKLDTFAVVGELALDGGVRPVVGALSMAMEARSRGLARIIVPAANAREASVVREVEVYGVGSLAEAVGVVTGLAPIEPVSPATDEIEKLNKYAIDFADVKGQEFAKRALTVAAAGAHNVIMLGSPGGGKTMLARRLPTILPPLTPDESLETTRIYSAVGKLAPGESLLCVRPFLHPPHHVRSAFPSRKRHDQTGHLFEHLLVADRPSATPVLLPVGGMSFDAHAPCIRPLARKPISALCIPVDQRREAVRSVKAVESAEQKLSVAEVPATRDKHTHQTLRAQEEGRGHPGFSRRLTTFYVRNAVTMRLY